MNDSVNYVLSLMPRSGKRVHVNFRDGHNSDIIKTLQGNFDEAVRITRKASKIFRGASDKESCKNVWNWVKENIKYKADGEEYQDIRLPNVLLETREGDCKSMALFCCAILFNLGISYCCFRYASYRGERIPSHVYCIVKQSNGNEIIVDPVFDAFNKENQPITTKRDSIMTIRTLSGLGEIDNRDDAISLLKLLQAKYSSLGVQQGSERAQLMQAITHLKSVIQRNAIGNIFDDAFHLLKAVDFTAPRNAFLAAVKLNVRGLADMMNYGLSKDPNSILNKWYQLGGSKSSFISAINTGKGKKPPLGWEPKNDWRTDAQKANDLAIAATKLGTTIYGNFAIGKGLKFLKTGNVINDTLTDFYWKAYAALKVGDTATVNNIILQAAAYRKSVGLTGSIGFLGVDDVVEIMAGAAGVLAAMYPIINKIKPGAGNDISDALDKAKQFADSNNIPWTGGSDPTADPNFKAEEASFFGSLPWYAWAGIVGAGAVATGLVKLPKSLRV